MPSSHSYDITTDLGGESDAFVLVRNLEAEGSYTLDNIKRPDEDTFDIDIAEASISFEDLKTALTTASPTMSLDVSSITIANDGVATGTVTVTDSRGASASGKVVNLDWNGILYSDANSLTLNGSGQGTVTLGPCPSGECTGKKGTVLTFSSDTEADFVLPVTCTVKFQ
jgi:hypothetical protein